MIRDSDPPQCPCCANEDHSAPLNVSQGCQLSGGVQGEECREGGWSLEHKAMHVNTTTPNMAPPSPRGALPAYYILIPFVGFTLIGCVVALVVYIRRRIRLDDLRHRLIPMYTYDATEQEEEDWAEVSDEDEELTEPLYKEGKLSFTSGHER